MRITRLHLRNYRVYEDDLDLELPPGLVGIYGPNGAGKSYLIEAITWAIWGRSRTTTGDVRTDGVRGECLVEVEFEHEGHLYLVRRQLSGATGTTAKALAHCDGLIVAEGVRDTATYLKSILGMDDAAFRASVFAEQKQVAAFSELRPAERRDLVLRLLGIMPLDTARDAARRDAKSANEQHDALRNLLPDLDALTVELANADAAVTVARQAEAAANDACAKVVVALADAEAAHQRLDDVGREHTALVAEGKAVRAEHDAAAKRVDALTKDLAGLVEAAARLAELHPQVDGLPAAETRLKAIEAVAAAERQADRVTVPKNAPAPPDEAAVAATAAALAESREALAAVEGELKGAAAHRARAAEAVGKSHDLSGEEDCPLCGQALGDAFAQVQAHRATELADAEAREAELAASRTALVATVSDRQLAAEAAATAAKTARSAFAAHEEAVARRSQADAAVAAALAAVDPPPEAGEVERLAAEVEAMRKLTVEGHKLAERVARRPAVELELDTERQHAADAAGRREALLDKVKSLGFVPADLDKAKVGLATARETAEAARRTAHAAAVEAGQASARVEQATTRLADARAQHAKLLELADEARHLGRLAELLNGFRTAVVAMVGPRLAAQAAELFAELTDHEYDRLDVDPETYEIRISDRGIAHGMGRFSGSETDLANLALRVAISEHVRFQSGGQVGLLVLDEVFGPLDDERKERMLLALERLKGRFRQVLVVTHDGGIKEEIPNAIEVVKLPGRRATARVI